MTVRSPWPASAHSCGGESQRVPSARPATLRPPRATLWPSRPRPSYGRTIYTHPDVLMVCGEERCVESVNPPVLLNPTLLVEVTAESTSMRDFQDTLDAYFAIDVLTESWIVDLDRPRPYQYVRQEDAVVVHLHNDGDDVVRSEALRLAVPLLDLYVRVELE